MATKPPKAEAGLQSNETKWNGKCSGKHEGLEFSLFSINTPLISPYLETKVTISHTWKTKQKIFHLLTLITAYAEKASIL